MSFSDHVFHGLMLTSREHVNSKLAVHINTSKYFNRVGSLDWRLSHFCRQSFGCIKFLSGTAIYTIDTTTQLATVHFVFPILPLNNAMPRL